VILGVAVVMVLIMWLTGSGSAERVPARLASERTGAASERCIGRGFQANHPATTGSNPAAHLADEPCTASGDGLADDVPQAAQESFRWNNAQPGESLAAAQERNRPRADPVKKIRRSGILSLFAPNVAFTYRKPQEAGATRWIPRGNQCFGPEHGASARDNRLGRSSPPGRSTACGSGANSSTRGQGVTPATNDQQKSPATSQTI